MAFHLKHLKKIASQNEVQTNQRPCIVSGFPSESNAGVVYWETGIGHTWVCDGSNVTTLWVGMLNTYKSASGVITTQIQYTEEYVTSLLHMNWGWDNGTDNGWFNEEINYTQAEPSDPNNYHYFQTVVYDIHP